MPHPYGYCVRDVPPLTNCLLNQQIAHDIRLCGCVGGLMYLGKEFLGKVQIINIYLNNYILATEPNPHFWGSLHGVL